jgi:hypothetical protein
MWRWLDHLFTVKSPRTPLLIFIISLSFLLSSFLFAPFQSNLLNEISSHSSSASPSTHSSSTPPIHRLSSKYLMEYHNWMILLNNSLPSSLNKLPLQTTLPSKYQQAQPSPHLILDHLIPHSILSTIIQEFPENPLVAHPVACSDHKCSNHYKQIKLRHPESYGPATAALYTFLQSPYILSYLEKISGIQHLIPGDHASGSGFHQTLSGGYLAIHSDSSHHRPSLSSRTAEDATHLYRRLNLYIFLNPDWEPSYGGYLEFWPRDLSQCQQRILPSLGRTVLFTTDTSFHGHPQKVSCPKDRSRRSLTMYYYTTEPPLGAVMTTSGEKKHNNYVKTKCVCGEKQCGEGLSDGNADILDLA